MNSWGPQQRSRLAWGAVALFVVTELVVKAVVDFVIAPAVGRMTEGVDPVVALGVSLVGTAVRAAFIGAVAARHQASRQGYHSRSELARTLVVAASISVVLNYVLGPALQLASGSLTTNDISGLVWRALPAAVTFLAFALAPLTVMAPQARPAPVRRMTSIPGALRQP